VNLAGNNTVAGQINNTTGGGGFKATSLGGNLTISANYTALAATRSVILSGTSSGTFSGIISDGSTVNLPLQKTGDGTWTLTGINTYTGATTISVGTLVIDEGSIATSSSIVNNAALEYKLTTNARTYANVISGTGTLTKSGTNSLTLSGVNTYSGDTTVSNGSLSLTNAASALDANTGNNASTVTIAATGATLDLTFTGTDIVDKLFIGGVQQPAGVYGPTATPLTQITNSSGSGTLTVATGPVSDNNYASWAASQTPPVTAGPNGDDDNDGVKNLVEYALADGQERGTLTGTSLGFTKRGAPYGGDLTYEIETSDNLGISDPWGAVTPDLNNASTISYTLQNPGDNFARLKVTQAP
jgi:autotransporter-associated beta strand protein